MVVALAVVGFLALADAYLESEAIVDLDARVEHWVVADMPEWAEWIARLFTWAGGLVGVVLVVGTVTLVLLRAGRRADAAFVLAVTIGVQIAVALLKTYYSRPRPDAGSPIELPRSFSFPSGHAATGIAVGGALAVVWAEHVRSPAERAGVLALGLGRRRRDRREQGRAERALPQRRPRRLLRRPGLAVRLPPRL